MTGTTDQKRPSEKLCPDYDDCADKHLKQAIADYLQWMKSAGYTRKTRQNYQARLNQFLCFSKNTTTNWDKLFTSDCLEDFKKITGQKCADRHQRSLALSVLPGQNTKAFAQPATAGCFTKNL